MRHTKRKHAQRGCIKPESFQFDKKTGIDDLKNGLVRNVKIIGLTSRHGYDYSPTALKEARQLYEGARVNVDHPERKNAGAARSYRDRFGKLENVSFVEGDGLRGDLRFNPKHAVAEQFIWDVQHDPAACGLSHNASGPLSPPRGRGSRPICESIERVRSVDLVADAATTRSLFEGKPRMKIKNKRRSQINPRQVRRKLMEAFGRTTAKALLEAMGDDPAALQAAAGAADAGGGDDANVEALMALIKRVIADPKVSAEDTIKLVSKRLRALKEMIPGGSSKDSGSSDDPAAEAGMEGLGDDPEDDDEDEDEDSRGRKTGKESRLQKLMDRLEAREEKLAIRELCEDMEFKPSERQLSLLLEAKEDNREDLIESWQEAAETPRSLRKGVKAKSRELVEGGTGRVGGAKPEYKTTKDWAKGLIA